MYELIKIENNEKHGLVVSSRDLAERLGKKHKHILETLDKLQFDSSADISAHLIQHYYKDKMNRNQREYLLTKDGFILYMFNIQGYNDLKMAYINRFNEMENYIKVSQAQQTQVPTNFKEALLLAYQQQERIEELEVENKEKQELIEEYKPKADKLDQMFSPAIGLTVAQFAKDIIEKYKLHNLGIDERYIYKWLRENGHTCKGKFRFNKPKKQTIDRGYMVRKVVGINSYGKDKTIGLITKSGYDFFSFMILNELGLIYQIKGKF